MQVSMGKETGMRIKKLARKETRKSIRIASNMSQSGMVNTIPMSSDSIRATSEAKATWTMDIEANTITMKTHPVQEEKRLMRKRVREIAQTAASSRPYPRATRIIHPDSHSATIDTSKI